MFFLSEPERRFVTRKLLPESRRADVHPELRGWSWGEAPVSPVYPAVLDVPEIAGGCCPTGRHLFLRRVMGVPESSTPVQKVGTYLRGVATGQLAGAVRIIFQNPVDGVLEALKALREPEAAQARVTSLPDSEKLSARAKAISLAEFGYCRLAERVASVLATQPWVSASGLAALAIPVTVDLPLDGRFLGLSPHMSVDAVSLFEPMVMSLHFGPKRDTHRLANAGYALALESLYDSPVNVGCITYVEIDGGRVQLERDIYLIDDELRQWFLEGRDNLTEMLDSERDPGRPDRCDEDCPYLEACRGAN